MAEDTRQGAYTERSPFYFQGSMDEQTLRRYTARAVTYQTLCDCETDIEEGLRLVTHVGAKFIGRAAHFSWKGNWTREQIEAYYALAARLAARAHEADPELIIQAGVFEIIYRGTVRLVVLGDRLYSPVAGAARLELRLSAFPRGGDKKAHPAPFFGNGMCFLYPGNRPYSREKI